MNRPDVKVLRELDHPWHVQINQLEAPHQTPDDGRGFEAARDGKSFMYDAKELADEVPRMALLFGMERHNELRKRHHQCSHDHHGEDVADNHLTCCLGVECRKCPFLAAIDRVQTCHDYSVQPSIERAVTGEERDVMKAWTCAAHIMRRGGDTAREGYIRSLKPGQSSWEGTVVTAYSAAVDVLREEGVLA